MNANRMRDAEGNEGRAVDKRTLLTLSPQLTFINLHNAAVKQAAKIVGTNLQKGKLNQFFVNTGLSRDGRTISDDVEEVEKFSGTHIDRRIFKTGEFEFGVVFMVNYSEDEKKMENNVKAAKQLALKAINEYFRWFSGDGKNDYSEDDLVEFIPNYENGRVQIKGNQIVTSGGSKVDKNSYKQFKFNKNNTGGIGDKDKMLVGFKVGYTLTGY
jgi:hypothetical protein